MQTRNESEALSPRMQRQLGHAADIFARRFSRPPAFAAFAPGRVNLIGDHTDYNDGFVLPMAIDRHTIVVADFARSAASVIHAIDVDETSHADFIRPLAPMPGTSANYVLGVADQFQKLGIQLPNLDVLVTSDIPIGGGLASSAALEVAFATLLAHVTGNALDPLEQAKLCQRAEHEFPGTPCGMMDMYVACTAHPDAAMLLDCRSLQPQFIPMPPPEQVTVLIINTGVKHELAGGEYAQRRETCFVAADRLNVKSLRDATPAMLHRNDLSMIERKRALHVIAENNRTVLAAAALASCDLKAFGDLMFASHDSLRDLFEVSCAELDVVVEAARTMHGHGVWGARMTGGGFGGCAVVVCMADHAEEVIRRVQSACGDRFGGWPDPFSAAASGAAFALHV